MGKLKIEQRVIGMVATNVYLGINMETKEAFLVDPADRAEDIAQWTGGWCDAEGNPADSWTF